MSVLQRLILFTALLSVGSPVQGDWPGDYSSPSVIGSGNYSISTLPAPSASYSHECVSQNPIHLGHLTLNDPNQIDVNRCVRQITGNYTFDGSDNRFHQVGIPYLVRVNKDMLIMGGGSLDEIYFPRLSSVANGNLYAGGEMILDMRDNLEYVDTPALLEVTALKVFFRANNTDLGGQNNLKTLQHLIVENKQINAPNNSTFLNGLANLVNLNDYTINGGYLTIDNPAVNQDPTDGGFLENLTMLGGNLTIDADSMSELYGLGNIQLVKGNLVISDLSNTSTMINLQGVDSISKVNGLFSINSVNSLDNLSGLGNITVGHLSIINNSLLDDISALSQLSIEPGGSVTISGNGQNLTCTEINAFTNQLDLSVSINTPGC